MAADLDAINAVLARAGTPTTGMVRALVAEVEELRALATALYRGIGALDDVTPGGFGLGRDVPELSAAIEAYEMAFPTQEDRRGR